MCNEFALIFNVVTSLRLELLIMKNMSSTFSEISQA